jgi:hypothetical protein
MFKYFWDELNYLWNEESLDNIFKVLVKKDVVDFMQLLFKSKTTHSIFEAMSY